MLRPDVDLPHCGASNGSQQREKSNDVRGLTICCSGDTLARQNPARWSETAGIGRETPMRVT
jgi:hypothetical protein